MVPLGEVERMDPILQTIILGVVSNGCTAFLTFLSHKMGDALVGRKFIEKWELEKTSLEPILQNVHHNIAEGIDWQGPPTFETVYAFLHSIEVETIIQKIYSVQFSEENKQGSLEAIRKEFLFSFSLYTGFPEDQLTNSSMYLLDALIKGCENELDQAVNSGKLSAHEAKSVLRYRLLLDKLADVQKSLTILANKQKIDIPKVLSFEEKYRSQVGIRHGYIAPPTFDKVQKLPISELYVNPNFTQFALSKKGESQTELDVTRFVEKIYRTVLLGNPGAGKSTLSLKLCHDLATHYSQMLIEGKQTTPILVILRDYGVAKNEQKSSILEFVETQIKAKYQVKPPEGAIEYLLLSGRVMVIFDGLDELLDSSYRLEISSDIESFCSLYPLIPVLVTSRQVGYDQAPLDERAFKVFIIAPFNPNQVEEYARKWFSIGDAELTPKQRQQKIEAFLRESRVVPDLRTNPLMLALICNIYRGENYIPRNRPEVYKKCATMLFERWDKSRTINAALPFDWHLRPLMEYLAYWIYANQKLRGGVTETELIEKTTEYLGEWLYEDQYKAEKVAIEFVEHCKGRAWVFTDMGTTGEGLKLYQFTHATFLEYFAAAYLVHNSRTPRDLLSVLMPRIAKREWDVAAQLAFQLQSEKTVGTGDELLTMLVNRASKYEDSNRKVNLLTFTMRTLEYIVPRPRLTRDIVSKSIEEFLSLMLMHKEEMHNINDFYFPLLNSAVENRPIIADILKEKILENIELENQSKTLLVLSIGLHLQDFFITKDYNDVAYFWENISQQILDSCADKIKELYPKHFWLCYDAVMEEKASIKDLIEWYGVEALFLRDQNPPYHRWRRVPLFHVLLNDILRISFSSKKALRGTRRSFARHPFFLLKEIGSSLSSPPIMSIRKEKIRNHVPFWDNINNYDNKEISGMDVSQDTEIVFGLFVILAILTEINSKDAKKSVSGLTNLHGFELIGRILMARLNLISHSEIEVELVKSGLNDDQQNLIKQWTMHELNYFVSPMNQQDATNEDIDF